MIDHGHHGDVFHGETNYTIYTGGDELTLSQQVTYHCVVEDLKHA